MTDQQQEGRWEKVYQGQYSNGVAIFVVARVLAGGERRLVAEPVTEADADSITRDHGQADVAEALRAENARLREALMRYDDAATYLISAENEWSDAHKETPDHVWKVYHMLNDAQDAAVDLLDAAPEEKQG